MSAETTILPTRTSTEEVTLTRQADGVHRGALADGTALELDTREWRSVLFARQADGSMVEVSRGPRVMPDQIALVVETDAVFLRGAKK